MNEIERKTTIWLLPDSEIDIKTGEPVSEIKNVERNVVTISDRKRLEKILEYLQDYHNFSDRNGIPAMEYKNLIEKAEMDNVGYKISQDEYSACIFEMYEKPIWDSEYETHFIGSSVLELKNYRINLTYFIRRLLNEDKENVNLISLLRPISTYKIKTFESLIKNTNGMIEEKKAMLDFIAPSFRVFSTDVIDCIDIEPVATINIKEAEELKDFHGSFIAEDNYKVLSLAKRINKMIK